MASRLRVGQKLAVVAHRQHGLADQAEHLKAGRTHQFAKIIRRERADVEAFARVLGQPVSLAGAQEFRQFDYLSPWEGTDYVLPGDEKAKQ